jgi:hypothetical protein
LGYEDEFAMRAAVAQVLDDFDPTTTIVNGGATAEGIGALYVVAKAKGFITTGIVSALARAEHSPLARAVDHVFYVEDTTWGGFVVGTDRLSPTSEAMVHSSDILVAIGGGEIARDELIAAKRMGKETRFLAADMNHAKAIARAHEKGQPPPTDFRGAAHGAL